MVNDKVCMRLPITKSKLQTLLMRITELFDQQPYLKTIYSALFSTAYFGLFRVGELTKSQHVVKVTNVKIAMNKKKILFLLESLKTHGTNVLPQKIKISSTEQSKQNKNRTNKRSELASFCPYQLLCNYLEVRPKSLSKDEQFFVFADSILVKPLHMRDILRKTVKKAGFDPKVFSTHSFRIGRGIDLLKCGLTIETIKQLGRWKSNSVFVYLKHF